MFHSVKLSDNEQCKDDESYTEVTDNPGLNGAFNGTFLKERFGSGVIIDKVHRVSPKIFSSKRTSLFQGAGSKQHPISSYNGDLYHNKNDKIRLKCKRGYINTRAKKEMKAICKCNDDGCQWQKGQEEWGCVSSDEV